MSFNPNVHCGVTSSLLVLLFSYVHLIGEAVNRKIVFALVRTKIRSIQIYMYDIWPFEDTYNYQS